MWTETSEAAPVVTKLSEQFCFKLIWYKNERLYLFSTICLRKSFRWQFMMGQMIYLLQVWWTKGQPGSAPKATSSAKATPSAYPNKATAMAKKTVPVVVTKWDAVSGIEIVPTHLNPNLADDLDSDSYWDHIYKKRPAAENDDAANFCSESSYKVSCRPDLTVPDLTYNGTCACRGRELLCGHKELDKISSDLPKDETISLLWV